MSYRRCAIAILVFGFLPSSVGTLEAQTSGRAAAYAFSEGCGPTAADALSNGNPGTLVSGATWTPDGYFGNAITVGNTGGAVVVAGSSWLDVTTAITLEAWIKPTTPGRGGYILDKGAQVYSLMMRDDGRLNAIVNINGGAYGATGPTIVPLNRWTHVAATYDGSRLRVYVNGVLDASMQVSGAITTSKDSVYVGSSSLDETFPGALDEVRIYARALSASELSLDMISPVDETTPFQAGMHTPATDAMGVLTTPVTAGFTRAIDETTLTATTFQLRSPNGTAMRASVAYDAASRIATLTPAAPLTPLTDYTAVISGGPTGITGALGTPMRGDTIWTFRSASGADAPVAQYAFSEGSGTSAGDSSGNANRGALRNGAGWTSSGEHGNALLLDGFNDGVEVPDADVLRLTSAFTFEAWVYPTARGGMLLNKAYSEYFFGQGDDGRVQVGFRLEDGGAYNLLSTSTLLLNTWSHIAATYDGTAIRLYINGVLDYGYPARNLVLSAARGELWVASNRFNVSFPGTVDDLRIYRKALDPAAIVADMMTAGSTEIPPSLETYVATTGTSAGTGTTVTTTVTAPSAPANRKMIIRGRALGLWDAIETDVPVACGAQSPTGLQPSSTGDGGRGTHGRSGR